MLLRSFRRKQGRLRLPDLRRNGALPDMEKGERPSRLFVEVMSCNGNRGSNCKDMLKKTAPASSIAGRITGTDVSVDLNSHESQGQRSQRWSRAATGLSTLSIHNPPCPG